MVVGPDFTTRPRPGQESEIRDLLLAAFARPDEADVLKMLHAEGALWQERVKPWRDRIGAYAAVVRCVEPDGWGVVWPLAVWPPWRDGALWREAGWPEGTLGPWRFGTRLLGELSISTAFADRFPDVAPRMLVACGPAERLARCGFDPERAARLAGLSGPLGLAGPGEDAPEARIVLPAALQRITGSSGS